MIAARSYAPNATEIAVGTVFGPYVGVPPLPGATAGVSPRAALEAEVLRGLTRPPCGVSFSGGRDSSLVLAVATHVARREGLPLPIPLTHVFPDVPDSREDQWQELAVGALGLTDWVRLSWHDEMDVLGPFATTVLGRVGVLDPFNAFFHEPLCGQVRGGSLLTGIGGDELLAGVLEGAAFRIRYRRRRPSWRQLGPLAWSYAPKGARANRALRAHPFAYASWVKPGPRAAAERDYVRWQSADHLAWDRSVRHFWSSRECHLGLAGLEALATSHDVRMTHPLSSAGFVAAMIATHGHRGPGGRAHASEVLVGDLLPAELTHREGKAAFGGAFWTGTHAGFAETWSGGGVDTSVVDEAALRAEWRRPEGPHVGSLLLLHQAWLHDHDQPRSGAAECLEQQGRGGVEG